MRRFLFWPAGLALVLGLQARVACADEVKVAVAANFAVPMQKMAAHFERETGHRLLLSLASTGRLYAQVRHGAPFEVLLAADQDTPARLEREGLAVAGTRITYATGRLVLWSRQPGVVDPAGEVLLRGEQPHLALADPKVAPYGRAAVQVLTQLGVLPRWQPRFVLGESLAQAHQFVASGNAPLGFVALSQVSEDGRIALGSAWLVPAQLHAPIRQDAVLLQRGRDKPAAQALLGYLRSEPARRIIRSHGYED